MACSDQNGGMDEVDRLAVLADVFEAVGAADIPALERLYTDDYGLEMPYAAEGPVVVEGRAAALARVGAALEHLRFTLTLTEVHPSADPDLVIAEYTSEGAMVATGAPYRNRYIGLWWFRDGKVCRTREFYNPLATSSSDG
jgi:ketosteroid isomerase-like protein